MNFRGRLERLEGRTKPSEDWTNDESFQLGAAAVNTLEHILNTTHEDVWVRDMEERIEAGEDYTAAMYAAKKAVWCSTEEGREALEVLGDPAEWGEG